MISSFFLSPIILILAYFTIIWGGNMWDDGPRWFGAFVYVFGVFLCASGSVGLLFGGPIEFWSALVTWL